MRIVLALLALLALAAIGAAHAQTAHQSISEIWLHDIPGPPQGDFWRPVSGNLLGTLVNPASVYPNVLVCLHPLSGGGGSCALTCPHFQGDTKLGAKGKSTECRRPVRIGVPASDSRFKVEVLDVDEWGGRRRVHSVIAQLGLKDPAGCPHTRPCTLSLPKGALVLSFATSDVQTVGPLLPRPASPSGSGSTATCQPWHGPYASIDEAMTRDDAGRMALSLTGTGKSEFGFVILRDSKLATGGYYLTPPVISSQDPNTTDRPLITGADYQTSWDEGISPTCSNYAQFTIVATVHTHPAWRYSSLWDLYITWSNNFSATDFSSAITLRSQLPKFEKILMINANDREVRVFVPQAGDQPFSDFGIRAVDTMGLPPCPTSILWCEYANRVTVLTTY